MKFVPRRSEIIGRVVVKRMLSAIVRPDETRHTTKLLLVDAVGADALAAGIRVGDIVLAQQFGNIMLDGGVVYRPIVQEKDVRAWVTDLTMEELVVQTDSGSEFVPFSDKNAAKSITDMGEREWIQSRNEPVGTAAA